MKSLLIGIIGALGGVFLSALFGINFSNDVEPIEETSASTLVQSQPTPWPNDAVVNDFSSQYELQHLKARLSFCEMDLQRAKMDAFSKQRNN